VVFYVSAYGSTRAMAEALAAGAEDVGGVRVSLYDIEGGEVAPFVDLIEEADALAIGSPTINGDAVKPVWDLLSSLTAVNVRGKIGAAFGSYGWTGEAMQMVEDRLRGLKLRIPVKGVRARLIPTTEELANCRVLGEQLALHLTGRVENRIIDMAELA
jgi:flavorubredoxin